MTFIEEVKSIFDNHPDLDKFSGYSYEWRGKLNLGGIFYILYERKDREEIKQKVYEKLEELKEKHKEEIQDAVIKFNTLLVYYDGEKTYTIEEYDDEFPKTAPEGFFDQLKGKPISEQLKYYRVTTSVESCLIYAGEENGGEKEWGYGHGVEDETECLFAKDGIVVGILIKYYEGTTTLLAGESVLEEYEDNNGAGYKSSSYRTTLACIIVK